VLELTVIIIILLTAFGGVAWYANHSSKQRTKLLEELDDTEEESTDSGQFGAVFQQELEQQSNDNDHFEIDSEPRISLSDEAKPNLESKQDINITIDDDSEEIVTEYAETGANHEVEPPPVEAEQASQSQIINDWDLVISFTVMAREGEMFSGKSIKATLESLDLHFGDLQIFHRSLPGLRKQTLFSVANILDPGTLNPESFATMKTPGLLIFARLPGPVNGLTLFDDLLDVAQKMTDKLDGKLCDEVRQPLNQASIEGMRSRILNLNIQMQTE